MKLSRSYSNAITCFFLTIFGICSIYVASYNVPKNIKKQSFQSKRRIMIQSTITSILLMPTSTNAAESNDIQILRDGYKALNTLYDNWDKATIDCTYADVPRELLESKNKAELLEKASTFALFDKSTSIVSCKKNNQIVRDYLGVTGKGPLVNMEKHLLNPNILSMVEDPEQYMDSVEQLLQVLSKAKSLSYTAGVADFDSVNTFAKGSDADILNGSGNSNLDQTKRAVGEARALLENILSLIANE